jgi:uncharacterized protein (TIGR02246 family)
VGRAVIYIKTHFMKYLLFVIWTAIFSIKAIGQSSVEDAIQNSLNDLTSAWNVHDPKAFARAFTDDADFTNVRGLSAHGRGSIAEFHTKPFATWFKSSNLKITNKKVRLIRPDLAAVDAWWEMTGSVDPAGKEIPFRKGLLNFLMTKTGDKWLIIVMHNMDLPSDL